MTRLGICPAFVLLLGLALAPGCASIALQVAPVTETGYDGPAIYSGTIFDVLAVVGGVSAGNEGSIAALLIFDLPFSLVMDTLFLPLSIYEQITGDWPLRREPEAVPDSGETPPDQPSPTPQGGS